MNQRSILTLTVAGALAFTAHAVPAGQGKADFRSTFPVEKARLSPTGSGRYFVLEPGVRLHLQNGQDTLVISVLTDTKVVDGVTTRVVEERETEGGQLAEVSRNFFAIDTATGDAYYFGEEVDEYKNGKVTGHSGSWLSGVNGARFGLMVPGSPKVGDRYFQEQAPNVAMDRAEVVGVTAELKVPSGTYQNCLRTRESSAIESGSEDKWYAPGVGLIKDAEFVLAKVEKG
jgi:hypothetical protein